MSGENWTAQVVWGTSDPSGTGEFGGIYGDIEDFGTSVGLWEMRFTVVTCDADTPADPADDYEGYVGAWVNGDGPGTVTVARNLASATVAGTITVYHGWQDDCLGTNAVTSIDEGVPLSLTLTATARPTGFRDWSHEKLASVYNVHQAVRSLNRVAVGTALLAGEAYAFDSGLISHNRWSAHENSR